MVRDDRVYLHLYPVLVHLARTVGLPIEIVKYIRDEVRASGIRARQALKGYILNPDMTRPDPGRDPKSSTDFADPGVHPRISPRPGSEPSSSLEARNLARDLMTILTCHLLHYDCMTRTDDISGLMHTSAKYALMTSADSDEISGIVHTSAKYARPLITTPLSAN